MREIDEDERREAIDERRRNRNGCKCGNPDWPGSCPGWKFCPVHGENESDEEAQLQPEVDFASPEEADEYERSALPLQHSNTEAS